MSEAETPRAISETEFTTDAFLGGQLRVRQPKCGYRAGIDPVLLAASCQVDPKARILDCGAGVGTAGLCLLARLPETSAVLVEREATYAAFAAANIAANNFADRASVVTADLTAPLAQSPVLAALANTFDLAVANPPYLIDTDGTRSTNPLKDAANAMPAVGLDGWLRFMAAMLKPGGTATLIHRADAIEALLAAMAGRFGGIRLRPIHAHADVPAHRLIASGVKGSRAPLSLLPGIVLHRADGSGYLPEVEAIFRAGAALM
jgi:tRNA1(Val) A37 N6-methylase TrmN6